MHTIKAVVVKSCVAAEAIETMKGVSSCYSYADKYYKSGTRWFFTRIFGKVNTTSESNILSQGQKMLPGENIVATL